MCINLDFLKMEEPDPATKIMSLLQGSTSVISKYITYESVFATTLGPGLGGCDAITRFESKIK